MTPEQAAACTKATIVGLGNAYSNDSKTVRSAREMGLSGWSFYVAGRGGALGDVRADTVAAAMGFIAPAAVRDGWDAARKVAPPAEVAARSLAECCRWGRERLSAFPGLERFVELSERVVVHADAAGMALFAAWRAMPIPDDELGAQAAVLLHLMRELRGGAHLLAVRATGLTPIEAIIAGPEGEAGATAFGWQPPFPPFEPLIRRRAWAEALTERIVGQAMRQLTPAERGEFVGLADALSAEQHLTDRTVVA